MAENFEKVFSHSMNRYAFGGVQVRDYVELKDTNIPGITDDYKEELDRISKEDLNIKVLEIVKSTPEDGKNSPDVFSAVIGQEVAGGLFPRKFTVPVSKLKVVGFNVPPGIPDSWKRKDPDSDSKPEFEDAPDYSNLEEGFMDRVKDQKSRSVNKKMSGSGNEQRLNKYNTYLNSTAKSVVKDLKRFKVPVENENKLMKDVISVLSNNISTTDGA